MPVSSTCRILISALVSAAITVAAVAAQQRLVAENGARYSSRDGAFRLNGSRGWLRVGGLFSDFVFSFEFRIIEESTDAAVVVRTWTGEGGWPERGYRIALQHTAQKTTLAQTLVGRRETVQEVTAGTPTWRAMGAWQTSEVVAEGARISISFNDGPMGVFEIEELAGHVLFEVKRGAVEFRQFQVKHRVPPLEKPANTLTYDSLKDQGGVGPRIVKEVKPRYTREAMQRGIEGKVDLEAVVLSDGNVGAVWVKRGLDQDLDQAAVAAVRRWRFEPATLGGQRVPVVVSVELTFTMK